MLRFNAGLDQQPSEEVGAGEEIEPVYVVDAAGVFSQPFSVVDRRWAPDDALEVWGGPATGSWTRTVGDGR